MKVLWVDDQRDVVNTLKRAIGHVADQVVYAPDGESALERLRSDFFDVLIVDLMMPPGTWGGLWLLEQLQAHASPIPVVVLSGEGDQDATILALRLGARDYVRKERVIEELADRIQSLQSEADAEVKAYSSTAPMPVAIPLQRLWATRDPLARLHRALEAYEAVFRFTALLVLADARRRQTLQAIPPALLASGAMGAWNQLRNLHDHESPAAVRRWSSVVPDRIANRVINIRNDVAHAGEPSVPVASERLADVEPALRDAVLRLRQIPGQLVIAGTLSFKESHFEVDFFDLAGPSGVSTPGRASIAAEVKPPVAGEVYFRSSEDEWLGMDPWVLASRSNAPEAWNVFLYDGVRRHPSAPADENEKLRYLDVRSSQRSGNLPREPTYGEIGACG